MYFLHYEPSSDFLSQLEELGEVMVASKATYRDPFRNGPRGRT